MPRARRFSDDVYNARRRARREIARIRNNLVPGRPSDVARVNFLQELIEASYKKADKDMSRYRSVYRDLSSAEIGRVPSQKQADTQSKVFRRQMDLASSGKTSALGEYGQMQVKLFYRATQGIWQGAPYELRDQMIMNALGTNSLEKAFTYVMEQNEEALRQLVGNVQPTWTTEDLDFSGGEIEYPSSPTLGVNVNYVFRYGASV